MNIYNFFFFQAEDGIRDPLVTGVQTCALPISCRALRAPRPGRRRGCRYDSRRMHRRPRSEERRVGKECRSRWSPHHQKKKPKEAIVAFRKAVRLLDRNVGNLGVLAPALVVQGFGTEARALLSFFFFRQKPPYEIHS